MKLVYKKVSDLTEEEKLGLDIDINISGDRPALCLELGDESDIPSGFTEISEQELEDLKTEHS